MGNKWKMWALSTVYTTALVCGTMTVNAATGSGTVSAAPTASVTAASSSSSFSSNKPSQTATITYTIEGMKQSVKGNLFVSSQGYYMYVLQGFKASAEEPGKDVVLYQRNPNAFMRIEKLPAGVDISSVRTNVITSLKAVGKISSVSAKSFSDTFFKGASFIYHAHANTVDQTAIVMKIKGNFYRILINAPRETESITPYFAIVKTIVPIQTKPSQTGNTGIVAGALVTSILSQGIGQDGSVNSVIQVKNQTEQVQQLTFNTGQKYDYILSKDGVVIGQYSRGKMFSQHVEFATLKQGDALTYPIQFTGLKAGHYHLDAWVTYAGWADSAKSKASVEFDVQ